MRRPVRVDLFAEDIGHAAILVPLVKRIADDVNVLVSIGIRSARGGHGRAMDELRTYLKVVEAGGIAAPDVLVLCLDANCATYARKRRAIEGEVPVGLRAKTVIACPDPHVEKWYLADPDGLVAVFGARPKVPRRKCERGFYKAALAQAVVDGGGLPMLGGIEFAEDIAEAIDLYRAGKNEKSLRQFLTDLRVALKSCVDT